MKDKLILPNKLYQGVIALLIVAVVIALLPVHVSAAASPDEPPPGDGAYIKRVLERRYQRMLDRQERQERMLQRTQELAGNIGEKVADLKADGKDTAILDAALNDLGTAITEASALANNAGSLLATHQGFDPDGKVVDVDLAQDTLYKVGNLLFESKEIIEHVLRDVRQAIREFRKINASD